MNLQIANCVSNLTCQTGILWLNIFTNPGSWSAESMSKVPKLSDKQSPSTKNIVWFRSDLIRSDLAQLNICFIWAQQKTYKELHAH